MLNDLFESMESFVGLVFFTDNGAIWKKGRNVELVNMMQHAMDAFEKWTHDWWFRLSKTKETIFY